MQVLWALGHFVSNSDFWYPEFSGSYTCVLEGSETWQVKLDKLRFSRLVYGRLYLWLSFFLSFLTSHSLSSCFSFSRSISFFRFLSFFLSFCRMDVLGSQIWLWAQFLSFAEKSKKTLKNNIFPPKNWAYCVVVSRTWSGHKSKQSTQLRYSLSCQISLWLMYIWWHTQIFILQDGNSNDTNDSNGWLRQLDFSASHWTLVHARAWDKMVARGLPLCIYTCYYADSEQSEWSHSYKRDDTLVCKN